ncbi:MAG: type II toxin-antitoxin system VapC family toxin [Candidatus Heimdallarchaeota archaeon]|nr:type II toxin-antitoxin system VapC family toxin [Candidatus Heimdallarchaeota archaeon]
MDTNILWWYFNENSRHYQKVRAFLDDLFLDQNNIFFVNSYVFIEFFHHIVKKVINGYSICARILSDEYSFINIISNDREKETLSSILEILNKYGHFTTIGGRDSSIIVSMEKNRIKYIISNDTAFDNVEGLKRVNPI